MSNGPKVVIDVNGAGRGHVVVDGTSIPCVRSVSTDVYAGEPPVVKIALAIADPLSVTFEGATLIVDQVEIPLCVERALWHHLAAKYGREIDVTTLNSESRTFALLDR